MDRAERALRKRQKKEERARRRAARQPSVLVQEFIKEAEGADIRCFVIGDGEGRIGN